MDGFLLVDKPSGWTSHDVVAKVRGITGIRKIGHAGTLDPMATGLLILGIGRATRLLRFVQAGEKEYLARAQLGVATDTLDADGAVLTREPMPVSRDEVDAAMNRFRGPIMQVPPMVSARKVEGKRLYELAREGKEVEREPRAVMIHSLDVVEFAPGEYPELEIRVVCSTGTYVRTLADDLARALGGRGHLTELRRTRNGSLTVDAAATVDELDAGEGWESRVIDLRAGLPDVREVHIDPKLVEAVANGLAMPTTALTSEELEEGPARLIDPSGRLLAIYAIEGHQAKPEVVVA